MRKKGISFYFVPTHTHTHDHTPSLFGRAQDHEESKRRDAHAKSESRERSERVEGQIEGTQKEK
jgi:hypothetical protein